MSKVFFLAGKRKLLESPPAGLVVVMVLGFRQNFPQTGVRMDRQNFQPTKKYH
jgi:hypothetical protein